MTRRTPFVTVGLGLFLASCTGLVDPTEASRTIEVWLSTEPTGFDGSASPRVVAGPEQIVSWGVVSGCGEFSATVEPTQRILRLVVVAHQVETLALCRVRYEAVVAPLEAGDYEFRVRHKSTGNGEFEREAFRGRVTVPGH